MRGWGGSSEGCCGTGEELCSIPPLDTQRGSVGGWQCSGRGAPSFTKGDILVPGSGEGRGFFLSDVGESVLSVMDSHCDSL